ncbi:hypothetical protein QWY90_01625 [Flavobacterium paronense]|uniref:hypothetical protein n=1 Tax=Flavobacterium paronense TaxID=1392775 RepID=UPI0025B3F2F7|nr:hypothetical protein [Flavobacterium paronense]MDN3676007.1 hypothetical protein [Flavobacterium paronense]
MEFDHFGRQSEFIDYGLDFILPEKGKLTYQFEKLDFSKSFSGNRHILNGLFKLNNWNILQNSSYLKSDGNLF